MSEPLSQDFVQSMIKTNNAAMNVAQADALNKDMLRHLLITNCAIVALLTEIATHQLGTEQSPTDTATSNEGMGLG